MLPLISLSVIAVNAVWGTAVNYVNAFFWAALFHGLQYLTIAAIFHVREQTRRPENRRGWDLRVGIFYGASVALAYGLFVLWPDAYVALGYERMLTAQLVVAVINIHHFVVDALTSGACDEIRTSVGRRPARSRRSLTRPGWFPPMACHRAGGTRSRITRKGKQSTHGPSHKTPATSIV